jgi:aminoglycoside N3'-acetyltransferase
MRSFSKLKKELFPKGISRKLKHYKNMAFYRTTRKNLGLSLEQLGIRERSVICIHGMLSSLGYLVGGPETVITAIKEWVSETTLMMATFPFGNATADYISTDPVYHVKKTPSKSGLLSEALRLQPGAKRSYHPTHPCVALGPKTNYLIDGSQWAETPFGHNSTYGRFSNLDEAVLLLIHTNNTSIVHRIQEIVEMPNLFLKECASVKGYDSEDKIVKYRLRIHTPIIPLYVVMPGDSLEQKEYVWFPDYVLLFPEYNKVRILGKIRSAKAKKQLIERHNWFLKEGIYKTIRHGHAEIAAVQVKPWLDKICDDLNENIEQFSTEYNYENMEKALSHGLLSKY